MVVAGDGGGGRRVKAVDGRGVVVVVVGVGAERLVGLAPPSCLPPSRPTPTSSQLRDG